jgi:hypothetical protein|tara:strand:- start:515 stop:853 length:339 start_codon:yes stop_codon:yes gene_type:complete
MTNGTREKIKKGTLNIKNTVTGEKTRVNNSRMQNTYLSGGAKVHADNEGLHDYKVSGRVGQGDKSISFEKTKRDARISVDKGRHSVSIGKSPYGGKLKGDETKIEYRYKLGK